MEAHALSDTGVELGGVLLGGQYEDEQNRPFVVIADALRARHYESTLGSFKFTHDTWAEFTRQRAELPADLQIVGWYHTHPHWGVFLSAWDLFICEHFFSQPADVALVIDPCQGDRGFFQWANGALGLTRRTGGFYVFASRQRAVELSCLVAYLENKLVPSF
jgi:proteasome lid subunit RPN8/RPN11